MSSPRQPDLDDRAPVLQAPGVYEVEVLGFREQVSTKRPTSSFGIVWLRVYSSDNPEVVPGNVYTRLHQLREGQDWATKPYEMLTEKYGIGRFYAKIEEMVTRTGMPFAKFTTSVDPFVTRLSMGCRMIHIGYQQVQDHLDQTQREAFAEAMHKLEATLDENSQVELDRWKTRMLG